MENTTKQNKKIIYVFITVIILLFAYVVFSVIQNNKNKNMKTDDMAQDTNKSTSTLRVAQPEDVIVINYSGKLTNGTEFDSSYKRGQPFVFQVGVGQVIKGWDEGLIGVKRGDKKTMTITPDKGYGDQEIKGQDGKVLIPKNSTLIFDVEVVEVISKADAERMVAEQKARMEAAAASSSTKR